MRDNRKDKLSKLELEVDFFRHYYFLQKIRFGEQLNLHLADNLTTVNGRIPAMSLQLIFENALKYNEITHRYPLDIDIYAEVGAVIVENSYHPRTDMPEASFGVGMESIQEIYRYYAAAYLWLNNSLLFYRVSYFYSGDSFWFFFIL